jgi:hypothetical protein
MAGRDGVAGSDAPPPKRVVSRETYTRVRNAMLADRGENCPVCFGTGWARTPLRAWWIFRGGFPPCAFCGGVGCVLVAEPPPVR